MCVVKKPSIPPPSQADQQKPLPILRNPILDGMLGNIASLRSGTSAFRIDLANPLTIGAGPGGFGGSGSGGGSGGSSGGSSGSYSGGSTSGSTDYAPKCVTYDSYILMADGSEKRAIDLQVGDVLWTRHEDTGELGSYRLSDLSFAVSEIVSRKGYPDASPAHRFAVPDWLFNLVPARLRWFRARLFGRRAGLSSVAKLTVDEAHTYYARHPAPGSPWRLSHNIKNLSGAGY